MTMLLDHVDWLWRIVPTAFFFGGALPIFIRAIRGKISADAAEGFLEDISRRDHPSRFWRRMSLYLLIAVALTVWFVLTWYYPLPRSGTADRNIPGG